MQIVNPLTAYPIGLRVENINGVSMRGNPEKQGWSFSRSGYLAAKEAPSLDADAVGKAVRQQLRPLSRPTLNAARERYKNRDAGLFPKYFIIEPNASCNKRCVFCPIIVTNRRGNMKWKHFTDLMEECAEYDVFGISLYQLSEPMLYRGKDIFDGSVDIAHMVDAAKSLGGFKVVNISTNGDVDNLDRLLDCNVDDVFLSIDGMTAEVYEQNRPSAKPNDVGAFDRTIERVMAFLDKKANLGVSRPWIRLQIINNSLCAPQVLDFIRHWIDIPGVDDILVKHLDGMNAWLGNSAVSVGESEIKRQRVKDMPCQHLWAIGSMVADGRYNACCHDSRTELTTEGAHVEKMRFSEWWNGEYMTEIRREHLSGVTRLPCRECLERDPWI